MSPLTSKERDRRYKKIRELMAKQELDGLVIVGTGWLDRRGAFRYVTNQIPLSRFGYVIFPMDGEPIVIGQPSGPGMWIEDVRRWPGIAITGESFVSPIVKAIKDLELERSCIGLGGYNFIPAPVYLGLSKVLPEATFTPADGVLNEARLVKGSYEIELLEKSAWVADRAFETFVEAVKPGRTEREVYSYVFRELVSLGAEHNSTIIPTMITERTLKTGDFCLFYPEFAGPGGYCIETGRWVSLGRLSREMQSAFEDSKEIQRVGLQELRPGRTGSAVYKSMAVVAKEIGFEPNSWMGHGVGLDIGELPFIYADDRTVLKPGMVVALHPQVSKSGITVLPVSDTFVVAENEPRRLCKSSLFEVV